MSTARKNTFEVRPRYTPGSPGLVDAAKALQIAREEWGAFQQNLSGVYGDENQRRAIKLGVKPQPAPGRYGDRGIVEQVQEHDNHWLVVDLITGATFRRNFEEPKTRRANQCARCLRAIEKARPSVFVFGSNEAGVHGAGAAAVAYAEWGAKWGQGVGRHGNSFAIPTKDTRIQTLPLASVQEYVQAFLTYAAEHPDEQFLVTRIGCGLAGFTDGEIAPLFRGAPGNCWLPEAWR